MTNKTFKLAARISSSNPQAIRPVLDNLIEGRGSVRSGNDGLVVEAEMEGNSAKELNRSLLSALRNVERKTTLRAEWTSIGTTERFFDYVLKKTITKAK